MSDLLTKLRSVISFCDESGRTDLADIVVQASVRIREIEAEMAKLSDSNSVHVSMLTGRIAKISMLQCAHTHGEEMVAFWKKVGT